MMIQIQVKAGRDKSLDHKNNQINNYLPNGSADDLNETNQVMQNICLDAETVEESVKLLKSSQLIDNLGLQIKLQAAKQN